MDSARMEDVATEVVEVSSQSSHGSASVPAIAHAVVMPYFTV